MSKLDELIAQYCPNGIDTKPLEQCCRILDNKRKPVTKSARESGEYPYYGANGIQDYVSEYIFDGTYILVGEDGSVMNEDGTPVVNWATGKIWVNNHAHIVEETNGVLLRYLYHYLQIVNVKPLIHGNIPKLTGGDFRALQIPVPPIEVQREIVRILDNYSELTTRLTTELTSEFVARKKQYEYYRDKLLTFNSDTKLISMGELFEFRNGLSKGKEYFGRGIPFIKYTDVYNNRSLRKENITSLVECTAQEVEKLNVSRGDVLFTRTSETVEDVGWSSVMLDNVDKCVFNGFSIKATPKTDMLIPEYCAYCFSTSRFRKYVAKHCTFTTRASLTGNTIAGYQLAVPSIDIQKRIVHVLDNFEAICNDLSIGLPAEIEARKKQYEFYRDLLLTYAEQGAKIPDRQTDRQTDRA